MDVTNGAPTLFIDLQSPVMLPPIVANKTLYVLSNDGKINAFR